MSENIKPIVAVVMGSISDWNVMAKACNILEQFGIPYFKDVVSAHRTPQKLYDFASGAHEAGYKAIIAGAGGAAHLPGMIASITNVPVIGVPVKPSTYTGDDSILSILQMPPGIPVATMALNGAENAGIYAAQIIGAYDISVYKKLETYKKELEDKVAVMSTDLKAINVQEYLKQQSQK